MNIANMTNVESRIENGKLILEIDLSQTVGQTSKGTPVVGQSNGFKKFQTDDAKYWLTMMVGRSNK